MPTSPRQSSTRILALGYLAGALSLAALVVASYAILRNDLELLETIAQRQSVVGFQRVRPARIATAASRLAAAPAQGRTALRSQLVTLADELAAASEHQSRDATRPPDVAAAERRVVELARSVAALPDAELALPSGTRRVEELVAAADDVIARYETSA